MKPTRPALSVVRLVLQRALVVSLAAAALLLIAAAGLRSFGQVRAQVLLTFVGLAVGAPLADLLLGVRRERPRLVLLGILAVLFSQTGFHLLVWTGWRTTSVLWRVWWISMVASVTITHLMALRAGSLGRRGLLERVTRVCAIMSGVMIAALALRGNLLANVNPVYLWVWAVPAAGAVMGSLVVLGRWVRGRLRGSAVPTRVKVAWIIASHVAVFAVGLYVGRTGVTRTRSFDALPSAMAHMTPAAVDAQVRADLARLKTVIKGLTDLETKVDALDISLRARFAAEGREYYRPEEDDRIRWAFVTYLSYRAALLRFVATYSGFGTVRDPGARARCFILGYAATIAAFRAGVKLVLVYRDSPIARRKLNEGEPAWGIPAGMFDRIYGSVASARNAELCEEMAAYFEQRRGERHRPDRELDFVLFLDADPAEGRARETGEDEFCASADRPREFNE